MSNSAFEYLLTTNSEGSNKAGSYIRALEVLNGIVREGLSPLPNDHDIWDIQSLEKLEELYTFVKSEQRKTNGNVFVGRIGDSYWKKNFCSAAVNALMQYVDLQARKKTILQLLEKEKTGEQIAQAAWKVPLPHPELFLEKRIKLDSKEGKEALRMVRTRVNQYVFRDMLLKTYRGTCCLTGLDAPALLRASHISPWAEDSKNRLNPENGLLLSATYDAAFDQHLITFDEDYRMVIGPSLRDHCKSADFQERFLKFEGKTIRLPDSFRPSQELLAKHREQLA